MYVVLVLAETHVRLVDNEELVRFLCKSNQLKDKGLITGLSGPVCNSLTMLEQFVAFY